MTEAIAVAVLAKAPIAGLAKTRLIPVLGAAGAAALQRQLIERAIETACTAAIGPVTVWVTPGTDHAVFQSARARHAVSLAVQAAGDLGARMLAAIAAANSPALVIGTDCPALRADHLQMAAGILRGSTDAVVIPVEDGGYALIGMRAAEPALFSGIRWGTPEVMEETRRRLRQLRLSWQEPCTLWDVDLPDDLKRLQALGMLEQLCEAAASSCPRLSRASTSHDGARIKEVDGRDKPGHDDY
jgi:rSAM/selenodomain-associated transferase 1